MLRYTTAGESHGKCLVTSIEGLPYGSPLNPEAINAELFVLHVDSDRSKSSPEHARALEGNIQFATNLGAQVVHLKGSSVPAATAAFVRENRVTQAIFGRSALTGIKKYLYFFAIQKFMSEAPHVDLHIVTQENR